MIFAGGLGRLQDLQEAAKYFELAASQGVEQARDYLNAIASSCDKGKGVAQDKAEAEGTTKGIKIHVIRMDEEGLAALQDFLLRHGQPK